jgi:hypothetical protein
MAVEINDLDTPLPLGELPYLIWTLESLPNELCHLDLPARSEP